MQCTNLGDQIRYKTYFEYFDQFNDEIIDEFASRCLKVKLKNGMTNCFIGTSNGGQEFVSPRGKNMSFKKLRTYKI